MSLFSRSSASTSCVDNYPVDASNMQDKLPSFGWMVLAEKVAFDAGAQVFGFAHIDDFVLLHLGTGRRRGQLGYRCF